MTFMLGDLREKLEPLGKTPLLRDVATSCRLFRPQAG